MDLLHFRFQQILTYLQVSVGLMSFVSFLGNITNYLTFKVNFKDVRDSILGVTLSILCSKKHKQNRKTGCPAKTPNADTIWNIVHVPVEIRCEAPLTMIRKWSLPLIL